MFAMGCITALGALQLYLYGDGSVLMACVSAIAAYDPDYDSSYVYYVESGNVFNRALIFMRGTISGQTITWGTVYTITARAVTLRYWYPVVITTSTGRIIVAYGLEFDGSHYGYYGTNPNNDGSGTWTNAVLASYLAAGAYPFYHALTSLTTGRAYCIYVTMYNADLYGRLWDGSAWGSEETVSVFQDGTVAPLLTNGIGLTNRHEESTDVRSRV